LKICVPVFTTAKPFWLSLIALKEGVVYHACFGVQCFAWCYHCLLFRFSNEAATLYNLPSFNTPISGENLECED
jgi:hypothetical protein